jgi:hypothetical protein
MRMSAYDFRQGTVGRTGPQQTISTALRTRNKSFHLDTVDHPVAAISATARIGTA